MLYLVVNNDFHLTNLFNQRHNFEGYDVCVICVPYNLNSDCSCLSDNVITISTPYKLFREFINPLEFIKAKKKVRAIKFFSEDTVIFLTDYDPINQYLVYSAKKKGARSILLEEGIATYYNNIPSAYEPLALKDIFKYLYLKVIFYFDFIEFSKKGCFLFLKLKDNYIDELVLYRDIKLDRNIKVSVVDSCIEKYSNLDKTKCLFINQPIYQSYLSEEEYLYSLSILTEALSKQFEEVFFKFHPRDSEFIKTKIKQIVGKWRNVTVVSESLDISATVKKHRTYFAISFFSDALFKLSESGVDIVFLFHLFPKLREHSVLISLSKVLDEMNYKLPEDIHNIGTGFYNIKNENKKSLKQVLQEKER